MLNMDGQEGTAYGDASCSRVSVECLDKNVLGKVFESVISV